MPLGFSLGLTTLPRQDRVPSLYISPQGDILLSSSAGEDVSLNVYFDLPQILDSHHGMEPLQLRPNATKTISVRSDCTVPGSYMWAGILPRNSASIVQRGKWALVSEYRLSNAAGVAAEWLSVDQEIATMKGSRTPSGDQVEGIPRCYYSAPEGRVAWWYSGSHKRNVVFLTEADQAVSGRESAKPTFSVSILQLPGPYDLKTLQGGRLTETLDECDIPPHGIKSHLSAAFSDDAGVLAIVAGRQDSSYDVIHLFDF